MSLSDQGSRVFDVSGCRVYGFGDVGSVGPGLRVGGCRRCSDGLGDMKSEFEIRAWTMRRCEITAGCKYGMEEWIPTAIFAYPET